MIGRPCKYNDQLASEICWRLAAGDALHKICNDKHMPSTVTVYAWLFDDSKKEFLNRYTQARKMQAYGWADQIISISDGAASADTMVAINRDRLKADNRKWLLSKLIPSKYGDKPEVEVITDTALDKNKLSDEELDQYIMLLKKMKKDSD
ncbi:hypothetical protein [Hymenobacter sp. APR13]|uniref:terminase small subunit-like protein n=1 Tax=Hymenobacter sp. APR13 TaxID=1356852 RepID=UPI0012E0B6E2|nr:hypothetical protein [Hymenobacter sp. APR13]